MQVPGITRTVIEQSGAFKYQDTKINPAKVFKCSIFLFLSDRNKTAELIDSPFLKMPKPNNPNAAREARNPLETEYEATISTKTKSVKRKARPDEDEEQFVGSKASRKILGMARELADEDENEESGQVQKPNPAFDFSSRFEDDEQEPIEEDPEAWGDEEGDVEEIEVAPGDREMFDKFHPDGEDPSKILAGWGSGGDQEEEGQSTNLADLIMEKINAFEAAQSGRGGEVGPIDEDFEIPPKVVEVYMK